MMTILPFSGMIVGGTAGCIKNAMIEPSIMTKNNLGIRYSDVRAIVQISDFCERIRCKPHSIKEFVGLLLIVDILPMCLVVLEEMGKLFYKFRLPIAGILGQGGKIFVKLAAVSLLHYLPLFITGIFLVATLKNLFKSHHFKAKIDPSGHALIVAINSYFRFEALAMITNFGLSSGAYLAFATVMGLAEGIWLYKTTVNHHSTADMITGYAVAVLSVSLYTLAHIGLQSSVGLIFI